MSVDTFEATSPGSLKRPGEGIDESVKIVVYLRIIAYQPLLLKKGFISLALLVARGTVFYIVEG